MRLRKFIGSTLALALIAVLTLTTLVLAQGTPFGNGRGAFRGDVYVPSVWHIWFGDNTTSDIGMSKIGPNVLGLTSGFVHSTYATVNVGTSGFTTSSTSLVPVTGLSWVLPATAQVYSYHCAGYYSQATAAAADAIGIASSVAPTNIESTGLIQTNTTAFTSATLATLSSTSATNIAVFTPNASATNYSFQLDGTLEMAAGGGTVSIQALSGSGSDALTINRGSYCQIY